MSCFPAFITGVSCAIILSFTLYALYILIEGVLEDFIDKRIGVTLDHLNWVERYNKQKKKSK